MKAQCVCDCLCGTCFVNQKSTCKGGTSRIGVTQNLPTSISLGEAGSDKVPLFSPLAPSLLISQFRASPLTDVSRRLCLRLCQSKGTDQIRFSRSRVSLVLEFPCLATLEFCAYLTSRVSKYFNPTSYIFKQDQASEPLTTPSSVSPTFYFHKQSTVQDPVSLVQSPGTSHSISTLPLLQAGFPPDFSLTTTCSHTSLSNFSFCYISPFKSLSSRRQLGILL